MCQQSVRNPFSMTLKLENSINRPMAVTISGFMTERLLTCSIASCNAFLDFRKTNRSDRSYDRWNVISIPR